MALFPTLDGFVARSGLAQSFWLGVAAILLFLTVLVIVRRLTSWYCCIGRHTSTSKSPSDDAGERTMAGDEGRKRKKDETALKRTNYPVSSYGATGKTLSSSTPHLPTSNFSNLRELNASAESIPLHSTFWSSYGAKEITGRRSHPYHVFGTEASVSPIRQRGPNPLAFFPTRYDRITEVTATTDFAAVAEVVGGDSAPSLPLWTDTQGADELEEEYTGNAGKQTRAPQSHDVRDTSDVVYPHTTLPERQPPPLLPPPSLSLSQETAVGKDAAQDRRRPLSSDPHDASRNFMLGLPQHQEEPWRLPDSIVEEKTGHTTPPPPPCSALPSVPRPSPSSQKVCAGGDRTTASIHAPCKTSKNTGGSTTPKLTVTRQHDEEDGGEAVTTQQDLHGALQAHLQEFERVQEELHAVLLAKEEAEAVKLRITDEVRDMERYKTTLDGIVAFTLRELEDAADGVEAAEAQMRRESTLALQNMLTAQETLRQASLRTAL